VKHALQKGLVTGRIFVGIVLATNLGIGQAASPAIGTVMAVGAFRMNRATVRGNATLMEGTIIESASSDAALELSSGTRFTLGADSRGRVFGDHVVLEQGQGRLDKSTGFRVEARGLTIQPETGNSAGRVVLAGATKVQVAAVTGSFRVLNSQGTLVAKLPQGLTLAFEPQAASAPTHLIGVLQNRGGHYLITDETTNVTVEVSGPGLAKEVGKRVEVTGATDPTATPVSEASQFIRIASVKQLPGGGTAAAGSGFPSGTSSGVVISAGTVAVIGGIAAAAVVGGLAATGSFGQDAPAPVSR
jgi:hypothetical protein